MRLLRKEFPVLVEQILKGLCDFYMPACKKSIIPQENRFVEYSAVAEPQISWNRAMESVIESQSSDGGSHDLCHGSQKDDLVFDHPFPLPHGNIPVNPHGIGRWNNTVKDGIGKGTAS